MTRVAGPAQPGQPAPGARRGMRTGTGIFLITTGAILRFALAAGSPHGLNLHIVGVILMLAGLLGLLLPPLARGTLKPDRLRRWVRPGQPDAYDQAPTGVDTGVYDDRPALVHDRDVPGDHGLVEDRPGHQNDPLPGDTPVRRSTPSPSLSSQPAGQKASTGAGLPVPAEAGTGRRLHRPGVRSR